MTFALDWPYPGEMGSAFQPSRESVLNGYMTNCACTHSTNARTFGTSAECSA